MVPAQPVPSDHPTAAAPKPIDSIHHNVPTTGQVSSSGLQIQRSSDLSGDTQPLSFVSQGASPDDAAQPFDHEKAISFTMSEQREKQRDELSQISDHDALEEASQSSTNTSQAKLTGGVQFTQQTSPISSPKVNSTSVDSGSLALDFDDTKITSRPPISESLGLWACAIIAGGTALTLAILGFLIFLWFGEGPAGGERATYVWRKIMLSETWPAQTITICALIVRSVAAAQAAVCTSLVAALLLERRRLPLSKVVPVQERGQGRPIQSHSRSSIVEISPATFLPGDRSAPDRHPGDLWHSVHLNCAPVWLRLNDIGTISPILTTKRHSFRQSGGSSYKHQFFFSIPAFLCDIW